MAKTDILAGATSQSVNVWIADSSSTTGAGLAGLVFNTSGLIAYYTFTGANATVTAITLATLAAVNSAYSSGGFKELDATNAKGLYRLDLPNAVIAAAKGRMVTVQMGGATNMAPMVLEITLTGWDNQDGVRGGMTALPNAAAGANTGLPVVGTQIPNATAAANGGLPTVDASNQVKANLTNVNAHAVTDTASGVLDVNAKNLGGTAQTGRDVGASVLLSAGTGTGQLDFTSGVVKANLAQILGTALTETAGQIAAAFKKFFNIATPASTMDHLTLLDTVTTATTATNLTNAPTAGDLTATMKASVAAAVPTSAAITAAVAAQVTTDHGAGSYIRNTEPDNTSAAAAASSSAAAVTAIGALPTSAQNADKLLGRSIQGGADGARTVTSALRKVRNKVTIVGGTMTVYQEDDVTNDHTAAVVTTPGDPISSTDPT